MPIRSTLPLLYTSICLLSLSPPFEDSKACWKFSIRAALGVTAAFCYSKPGTISSTPRTTKNDPDPFRSDSSLLKVLCSPLPSLCDFVLCFSSLSFPIFIHYQCFSNHIDVLLFFGQKKFKYRHPPVLVWHFTLTTNCIPNLLTEQDRVTMSSVIRVGLV